MDETLLFCFVFLSQVLLISRFYAARIIKGRRYVLQNFRRPRIRSCIRNPRSTTSASFATSRD
jgi:hypothetical protein